MRRAQAKAIRKQILRTPNESPIRSRSEANWTIYLPFSKDWSHAHGHF